MSMQAVSASGDLEAIVAAYNDVTGRMRAAYEQLSVEIARLHDELASKNRELARRERLAALGQLAAGMAHEVRNPLGAIALYASMLERDLGSQPAQRELARKVSGAVRSLDRLVGEILEFSQESMVERQLVRFGDVIGPALDGLAGWTVGGEIEILLGPGAADVVLWCDASRLGRALLNVLLNAVQAMGDRGRVGIDADSDGERARVVVWDTGPGIPDDRIERIFDPFYTSRSDGTGLGLAIVHQIVEAHGGRIRVTNRREGGARFELELPGPTGRTADVAEPHRTFAGRPATGTDRGRGGADVPDRKAS